MEALAWRGVGTGSRLQTWRKGQARQDQEGWQQGRCVEREEGWGRPRLCTFGVSQKGGVCDERGNVVGVYVAESQRGQGFCIGVLRDP